jgi:hypothetical protein
MKQTQARALPIAIISCIVITSLAQGEPQAASQPPGREITLFRIGMSEDDVVSRIQTIPAFHRPDNARPIINHVDKDSTSLVAQPWRIESDRPRKMQFLFTAHLLEQAELEYRAEDGDSQHKLYDRLSGPFVSEYTRATDHVAPDGLRSLWLSSSANDLLVLESSSDSFAVKIRLDKPQTLKGGQQAGGAYFDPAAGSKSAHP